MRAEVQPINEKGRFLRTKARHSMAKYIGTLSVAEARDTHLQRTTRVARLISLIDGNITDVLPALHDAQVLYIKDNRMRMRGFEVIDELEYGQVWDIFLSK